MCVVRILYEDIIKFLLLSQKTSNERAPSLCFGLVWALENYFLLDSAEFYVMNSYSGIATFGSDCVNRSLFFMSRSLWVLRTDSYVKNAAHSQKVVRVSALSSSSCFPFAFWLS